MLAEEGPVKLALFDLDGTLLPIDSDHAFGEFLIAIGWADADEPTGAATMRSTSSTRPSGWTSTPTSTSAPRPGATGPRTNWPPRRQRFVDEVARPALRDSALALVQRHREAGDLLAW
jgi:phosphoserine phosphatase